MKKNNMRGEGEGMKKNLSKNGFERQKASFICKTQKI
jgi:hypothetical protein